MQKFDYEAKDNSTNKVVKATVQAESETAASKLLVSQGFTPISITESKDDEGFFAKFSNRITVKDKVVFTRQLSTLIAAGLPLSQSLRSLVDQTQNKRFRGIVQEIIASVEGGKTLHDSFAKHPEVFDKLFLALVAAGEKSGTLDDALQRIAAQQEKDAAITSRIRGAMTYPVIVLFVIIAVMVFMLFTVVPQVERLYIDLNKELPFITQLIVGLSTFAAQFWWLIVIAAGIGVYMLIQYSKTEAGRQSIDSIKLSVPVFKGLYQRLYMARFMRMGQTLLHTGVSMLDMLKISGNAVNNSIIEAEIERAAEKVKGGKDLSTSLSVEPHMPPLVHQMIKVGEKSGRIDEMMGKTATIYENELDEEINSISTAIEPVLMVVLAIVAGGMVAAILLPIYSLVNTLQI